MKQLKVRLTDLAAASGQGHAAALVQDYPVYQHLVCTAVALALFLLPPRAATVGHAWSALEQLPAILIASVYDTLTVIVLALAAAGGMWLLRERRIPQLITLFAFDALAVVMLILGMANVRVVQARGAPLNYRGVYHAELLHGRDASATAFVSMHMGTVCEVVALCGAMLLTAFAIRWALRRSEQHLPSHYLAVGCAPALVLYVCFSHWYLTTQKWNANTVSNPLVALVGSTPDMAAALFQRPTPATTLASAAMPERKDPAAVVTVSGDARTVGSNPRVAVAAPQPIAPVIPADGRPIRAAAPVVIVSVSQRIPDAIEDERKTLPPITSAPLFSILRPLEPRILSWRILTWTGSEHADRSSRSVARDIRPARNNLSSMPMWVQYPSPLQNPLFRGDQPVQDTPPATPQKPSLATGQ